MGEVNEDGSRGEEVEGRSLKVIGQNHLIPCKDQVMLKLLSGDDQVIHSDCDIY